jgi:non-specific serine/threonine protein kinase
MLGATSNCEVPEQCRRAVYSSNGWEIDLGRRELRAHGVPVPLGGRAFEIIEVLLRAGGELVGKYDLMNRVWPGAIVEDNTLQFHISAIRKALGADRELLKTVSGRGYRLLGPWATRQGIGPPEPAGIAPVRRLEEAFQTNIPLAASALIGRTVAQRHLLDALSAYRVITLAGPAGIGKSVLALEVARSLIPTFAGDCWMVELVALSDASLVPSSVAHVLGLRIGDKAISGEAVARAIGARKLLLVLDNCEHLIDAVAGFVETVVRICPHISVLATSRETLRVEGEYVHRVPPLDVPPRCEETGDTVIAYSAIQLFIARIVALNNDFLSNKESLAASAAICRRLDGIPLAIEFAASRAATLGIQEVAARLDNRFALLTGGRRTSLPRHHTLRAALDWSYELLSGPERGLLRHLAVFPAGFTLQAAAAVANDGNGSLPCIAVEVSNLVSKSLVSLDESAPKARWRLLESIRVYAHEKLSESGEAEDAARRSAQFFHEFFASQPAIEELDRHVREVDNVRAALRWAFGDTGDAALGCALAASAMDFWFATSLLIDCCEWGKKAIARIDGAKDTGQEMVLQCGLGLALLSTGAFHADAHAALTRALALAQAHEDIEYQQRALYGLSQFFGRTLQFRAQLNVARLYEQIVRNVSDPAAQATADWLIGTAQLPLKEHSEAPGRLRRAIDRYPFAARSRDIVRFGVDPPSRARSYLAGYLFFHGSIDTAVELGERAIEMAREVNHPSSLCHSLTFPAITLFLKLGDIGMSMPHVLELIEQAGNHGFDLLRQIGLCAQGSLEARHGDSASGIELLRFGLNGMRERGYNLYVPFFQAELAEVLALNDHVEEGLAEIEAALQLPPDTDYLGFIPEAIRIKGQILAMRSFADREAAEELFRQSLEQARRHEALYLELRSATSLAEFWITQNRVPEARELLGPIYARFTEGFMASDLQRAKRLLEQLA